MDIADIIIGTTPLRENITRYGEIEKSKIIRVIDQSMMATDFSLRIPYLNTSTNMRLPSVIIIKDALLSTFNILSLSPVKSSTRVWLDDFEIEHSRAIVEWRDAD